MSTPTDPYSSNSRRPFEDDEILAPISPETASSPETTVFSKQVKPPAYVDDSWTNTDIFPHTQGMDPAFDQQTRQPQPLDVPVTPETPPEAPTSIIYDDDVKSPASTSPAGVSRTEVISDYSEIDYSFGADDDHTEDTSGTTETRPDSSAQQTSVISTSSPASAPTATAQFAAPAPIEASAADPTPVNAWAAPATASPAMTPPVALLPPVPEAPRGRGWTHTWVLLATLLLVPVGYYLLSDSINNLELGSLGKWAPETGLNWLILAELAGGLVAVALVWFITRLSSLGAIVIGTLLTVAGLISVLIPSIVQSFVVTPLNDFFGPDNSLVNNIISHLGVGLGAGRILTFGVLLLMTGVVSHSARRRGEKYGSITTRRESALGSAGN